MAEKKAPKTPRPNGAAARDARLKAALKANLARRKAQARARAAAEEPGQDTAGNAQERN